METLVGNVIEEINESRAQMFDILENIAVAEASTDPKDTRQQKKKANKKAEKEKKKSAQPA